MGAGRTYRPVAVTSWGAADCIEPDEDVEDDEDEVQLELFLEGMGTGPNTLNNLIRTGKVAEVDLTCAAGDGHPNFKHIRGSGRVLLIHTLARIAAKKKAGRQRFDAIVTYLAADPNVNGGIAPLLPAVQAMGFVPVNSWFQRPDGTVNPTGRHYYCLKNRPAGPATAAAPAGTPPVSWMEQVAGDIRWSGNIQTFCPLSPRSGIPYCT
jgi:hypothetical protein